MSGKYLNLNGKSYRKSFWSKYKKIILSLILLCLVAVFYVLIQYSAFWLVRNDEYKHVKYALILDGQGPNMERSDYALKLLREKKIDTIIVSGSRFLKNYNTAEISRKEMLSQGDYNPNQILTIHHKEHSTLYEAKTIIPYLKARKVDSILLITSSMAAARVNDIFTKLSGDKITYLSTDMDYNDFVRPETWTTSRFGKKIWLKEMLKRFYTIWELWNQDQVKYDPKKQYIFNHQKNIPTTKLQSLSSLTPNIPSKVIDQKSDSIKAYQDSIFTEDSLAAVKAKMKIDSLDNTSKSKDSLGTKDSTETTKDTGKNPKDKASKKAN